MGILNYILRIMRVVGGVANKDFQAPSPQMSVRAKILNFKEYSSAIEY